MALIKCTECGKEISNKASSCPNCGCPIEEILKSTKTNNITSHIQSDSYVQNNVNNQNIDLVLLSKLHKKYADYPTYATEEYASAKKIPKKEAKKIIEDYYKTAPPAKYKGKCPKRQNGSCLKTLLTIFAVFITFMVMVGSCGTNEESSSTNTNISFSTEPANSSNNSVSESTNPIVEEDKDIPTEYKSALKKAQNYSDRMFMSKKSVYNQLTSEYGEQFSAEAAQYAIDNVKADWNYNALQKAKSYSDKMHMSKAGVYDQLTSEYGEQFTDAEAQYAVDNVNADWNYNALQKAKSYQDKMSMSPSAIHDQLISEYGEQFTVEEADYAIANLN